VRSRLRGLAERLRTYAAAYGVLAVALAATVAVHMYVASAIARQVRARFDERATATVMAVKSRMDAYVASLRATSGLFVSGHPPSRDEFRLFVRNLNLDQHYPGILGIGYSELLAPADVRAHEEAIRREGFPRYRVWPEGNRDLYSAIAFLEPFDERNQRAFGFDMLSEPARQEAMLRARATGHAACTARVELVQETGLDRQPGFLIYLPVTGRARGGLELPVVGFVYAPFRARDLLDATLPPETLDAIHLDVADGTTADPTQLLYASPEPGGGELATQAGLTVAGRPWTLRFEASSGFTEPWERWLPRWAAIAGVLVSLLLFRVARAGVRGAAEARRAAERASFLADAGRVLSSSLDYRATLAEVAARAAQGPCDACLVLLSEPGGPVRLVGLRDPQDASAGDALVELALGPEARFAADAEVDRTEPFVASAFGEADLYRLAHDADHFARLRETGVRALAAVPLRARGDALGAIAFASTTRRSFGAADAQLMIDLARLAGAAIDTARLYRREQAAVKLRDEFLSIASHELKTPLTSLALQADSLRAAAARGFVADPLARKMEVIRRNVDRLSRLITNLLDISRIGEGRLALELEEVDLSDLLCEVAGRFEDELARAGSTLQLDVPGPVIGRWDRLRLDQVVTNLVANAVKYGPGKPIEVTLQTEGDRVALTVRDHGIGIPREAQQRIFERFERAVSDRHFGGLGLGLWISRRIVEALGGTIGVESEAGQGATFTVELWREPRGARVNEEPASAARTVPS
jgi:signal transduction histidine kinase/CHASE1-domain containing sensor protein